MSQVCVCVCSLVFDIPLHAARRAMPLPEQRRWAFTSIPCPRPVTVGLPISFFPRNSSEKKERKNKGKRNKQPRADPARPKLLMSS